MTLLVALLLGAVQGLFMFVPVSSTSHLVLAQTWLREAGVALPAPDSPELILFDLVVHVGTLVSIVIVMRAWLKRLVVDVVSEWRERRAGSQRPATRLIAMGIVSVAVTGVLGLIAYDPLTSVFGSPTMVGVALIATGGLLWWTDAMTPDAPLGPLRFGWRGPQDMTLLVAVLIGVAQAAALAPGLSRSGTTIFAALLLGLDRRLAARFSFTIAIPTILAATGVQTVRVGLGEGFATIPWTAMATGFVVAAAVGTVALWAVLKLLEAARFRIFSFYVWGLAAVVLITGIA